MDFATACSGGPTAGQERLSTIFGWVNSEDARMIIELIGTPGSGKTTASYEVVQRLREVGHPARKIDRDALINPAWKVAPVAVISNPWLAWKLATNLTGGDRRRGISGASRLLRVAHVARVLPDWSVLDTGVLFNLVHILNYLHATPQEVMPCLPQPDKVIWMHIDANEAVRRVRERNVPNSIKRMEDDKARDLMARYEKRICEVAAASSATVYKLEVDGLDPVEVSRQIVSLALD
jgi:shikimate kinase